MGSTGEHPSHLNPVRQAFLALEAMQAKLAAVEWARTEPVAIIGIGCRFPGGANDPESFWRNLREGVDAIREVPSDRWDVDAYYDPDPEVPGKANTRWAGFLDQVDQFDPQFFGIAPREAASIDPQQRLLLEVSWEALENAGQAPTKLSGSRTGVFIGIASSDYSNLQIKFSSHVGLDAYYSSGIAHSVASGRLSYVFGLQGPSLSIDTACSSSLVAVHLACQSLRNDECTMALAGGVNVILSPDNTIAFSKSRMLASDGRCKTFDARADGFAEGEGCGIVVLKRLSQAVESGDRILAIIRGTAINQDGPSSGLTAPNGAAQRMVIREALANGGVQPLEVSYVEAHGTGTSLGDPIEVQALGAVLGENRLSECPFMLGSVKTNVGHLEAAAGIVGLIKVALSLQHGEIPPHLHLRELNPFIPWREIPVIIPTKSTPWTVQDGCRIAGVSSFGFSGTNAHVILEGAPAPLARPNEIQRPASLLVLSAKGDPPLQELAQRFAQKLDAEPSLSLADLCYTASTGRAHFPRRLALVATSTRELQDKLAAFLKGESVPGLRQGEVKSPTSPKVAFLFTGQGSQYPGMAKQLFASQPVFRQTLEECDRLLQPCLPLPLLSVLFPAPGNPSPIDQTQFTQPALFALEYALAQMWRSWGIQPSLVLGHSVGEYVAACLAGVFSLPDALRLIVERGRLMQALPLNGGMAAVNAPYERVMEAIRPFPQALAIAAVNGPDNLVVSGEAAALEAVLREWEREGVKARRLKVSHAFHSPLMDPMLEAFREVARGIEYHEPQIRLVGNRRGEMVERGEVTNAEYWVGHVREAVQFGRSIETLRRQGVGVYLEVGPGTTLLGMGKGSVPEGEGVWLPSLRPGQEDWPQVLSSLGGLYVAGVAVDWEGFEEGYAHHKLPLPTYPFQRKRYWIPSTGQTKMARSMLGNYASESHPLLGQRLKSPLIKDIAFECQLGREMPPFLADHRVFTTTIVPAAAYLEMVLAAGREALGHSHYRLDDVVIREALELPEYGTRNVQLVLRKEGDGQATFQVFSEMEEEGTTGNGSVSAPEWSLHATGKISAVEAAANVAEPPTISLTEVATRCAEEISPPSFYGKMEARGLELGSSFQGVVSIRRRDGEALGQILLPEALIAEAGAYGLHPALLDAGFQLLGAAVPIGEDESIYVPVSLERFEIYRPAGTQLWGHVTIRPSTVAGSETITGDIGLFDEDERAVAVASGLSLKRVDRAALLNAKRQKGRSSATSERPYEDWLYEVVWRPSPIAKEIAGPQSSPEETFRDLSSVAERVQSQVAFLSEKHGLALYDGLLRELESLSLAYTLQAFRKLGWEPCPGERVTLSGLANELGIVERYRRLLARLLSMLEEEGVLRQFGDQWETEQPLPFVDEEVHSSKLHATYPSGSAEQTLLDRCGPLLAEVLRGEIDPLQLLFPDGSLALAEQLYQESPAAMTYNRLVQEAISASLLRGAANRPLRVLEIGAGTGGTTAAVLASLPPDRTEYYFTDVSPLFIAKAREKFDAYPFLKYTLLDIEIDPASQGFAPHQFDVIIAANVIHATADLRQTLKHIRGLLAPDGLLVMVEVNQPQRWVDLTFGLTEGWWKFTDEGLRPSYPLLPASRWLDLLSELGFAGTTALPSGNFDGSVLARQAILLARNTDTGENGRSRLSSRRAGYWLVFADGEGIGDELTAVLAARDEECVVVRPGKKYHQVGNALWQVNPARPEDFERLLSEVANSVLSPCRGVIHLWSLDTPPAETLASLENAQKLVCGSILHLVQALAKSATGESPGLWLVTRGGQPVEGQLATDHSVQNTPVHTNEGPAEASSPGAPGLEASAGQSLGPIKPWVGSETNYRPSLVGQASVWGLGSTISLEHPEFHCTRVDLDPRDAAHQVDTLLTEVLARDGEDQIAYRRGTRYVGRLVRSEPAKWASPRPQEAMVKPPVRLEIVSRGLLDNLSLRPLIRRNPAPDEVEIRVCATGLNFKDVLNALGMYPGDPGPLGGECAGRVVAVGLGVRGFQIGDEVLALATGCFSSFVTTKADFVAHKPKRVSFEEAATLAIPFVTAYFALHYLGKMKASDRVLIHAAAGGVGLAAVQLAQSAGAEVFATAGSEAKRDYLRSLGVKHVMDSRSLDFTDEIMVLTEGQGVDVVLNSLAAEFIPKSLSVLKPNGRFLELGKSGLLDQQQIAQLGNGRSYFAIDWGETAKEDLALVRSLLDEVVTAVDEGNLEPLPLRVFPLEEVGEAFRFMAQAKHIGKIVVSQKDSTPSARKPFAIRADATYLISGGLGGLGLFLAQWLADKGARHLVLLGRSKPSPEAQALVTALGEKGVQVRVAQADVAKEEDLRRVLLETKETMPEVRGIIHAAGTLDDGVLIQQDWSRFEKVMAPKVTGGWLLHQLSQELPLEFFVLFSSAASVLGSPGQGNHAAANAFLDALAHYRSSLGLPALSINWGAWSGAGAATKQHLNARITTQGAGTMAPDQGLAVLEWLIDRGAAQVVVVPIDWPQFRQGSVGVARALFLSEIVSNEKAEAPVGHSASADGWLERLEKTPPSRRRDLLLTFVQERAGRVLGIAPSSVRDRVPLKEMGLDSLMAVELRTSLGSGLGLARKLPATLVFDYPTVEAIADHLAQDVLSLQIPQVAENHDLAHGGIRIEAGEVVGDVIETIEDLSDEEVDRLFAEKTRGQY